MTEHFVTLFNRLFLPQGISLYRSLCSNNDNFKLWVICMDEITYDVLLNFDFEHLLPLRMSEYENETLLKLKSERSIAEYCWTVTPITIAIVFRNDPSINRVTYLDADLYFFEDPLLIINEFVNSKKDVLITEHAYSPFYDMSKLSGKFCVQFLTFNRDGGEIVRQDWESKCLDWCFNRFEDGKFGDQMYLDQWPKRFPEKVHVLQDKELLLAPWNAIRFPISNTVAYHFHRFRILKNSKFYIGSYLVPKYTYKYVYKEYIKSIKIAIKDLENIGEFDFVQMKSSLLVRLKSVAIFPYLVLCLTNLFNIKSK